MKQKNNIYSLLAGALFLFLSHISNAQSYTYGTWNVGCAIEKTGSNTASFCEICPTTKVGDSSLELAVFDITIDDKTIKVGSNNPVTYTWDNNTNTMSFSNYVFRVLQISLDNTLVWRAVDKNCILVFQKKGP